MEYSICYGQAYVRLSISLCPNNWGIMRYSFLVFDRIMMFMKNRNRLIDDFKYQTATTIWKHLDAMAANYAVYSTCLKHVYPFLKNYDVYLYCNDTNIVIMCLDCCGHGKEQTFEESETLTPLILSDGEEPRVSVVWQLAEAVRYTKNSLKFDVPDINVYGLLLTEANILNAYDLCELWNKHGVTVIDNLKRLKYRAIRVNTDSDLPCKTYVNLLIDKFFDEKRLDEPATTEISKEEQCEDTASDDEFEKRLDDFIRCIYEGTSDDNTEEQQEADTDNDTDNDEEEYDGEVGKQDIPFTDDDLLPDGVISQNNNISVKVDILRPIPNPREELDKLVGCDDIKQRMDELLALTSYNKILHKQIPNARQHEVSLHSVFLGRPGTGKTTVCKIFGSLLRQAGVLSRGHVVVCDRGTFIGTLWGDEERSLRQVIGMAQGGVLMIDEAYLLNGNNNQDPGKVVIQLLMNILADEWQRDIAVVLCGYKEPMMKLLDCNPGLFSRFPNRFEFVDFTVDELLEITRRRIKDYDYKFTVQAWEKYSDMLAQAHRMRDPETWGNARFVANLLEHIYIKHATRCVRQHPDDKHELLTLTPEDVLPIEVPRKRTKIGF